MCRLLVLLSTLLVASQAALFPTHWATCKLGPDHNKCLKSAIQKVIPDLVKGMPNLGILSIDPLRFVRVSIEQGKGPVSVDLDFRDVVINGLKNVKIEEVENDWKTMNIYASVPVLKVNSKYKIAGKVLVLPVHGDGDCNLEFEHFTAKITLNIDEKTVNKKKYYNVKSIEFSLNTDPLHLRFNNLFDGNKELGDHFNVFINENWRDIFQELKPAVERSLKQACTEMATRFFMKVPKNEITPA